ncbi:MAG: hypothetical protein L0206_08710, partial [Actinobacteria bacterium]|nr:hypothetical protein [Actinomycetota bacterium]
PRILGLASDERYLTIGSNGQADPHIAVTFEAGTSEGPRSTDAVQARHRLTNAGRAPWIYSSIVDPAASPLIIGPVVEGSVYEVQMRAAHASNFGAWSIAVSHRVVGRTTPPPAVSDLRVEQGRIRWEYPNRPLDLVGFLVRWSYGNTAGLSWDEAHAGHVGVVTANDFPTDQIPTDGTVTILVKAVDQLGIQSLMPAFVVVNIGGRAQNVILDVDHKALGWPGTKVNCAVGGVGQLKADTELGTDAAPMWLKDAAGAVRGGVRQWNKHATVPMWAAGFGFDSKEAVYSYMFYPDAGLVGDTIRLPTVATPQDAGMRRRYRARGPSPAWQLNDEAAAWTLVPSSLAWKGPGEWLTVGTFILAQRQPYEVELLLLPRRRTIADGTAFTSHNLRSDVEDAVEFLNDVVIPKQG